MIDGVGLNYANMYIYQPQYNTEQKTQEKEQDEDMSVNQSSKDKNNKNKQDRLELTPQENEQVKKLQDRDLEVRQHEAEHMAVGGGLIRGGMKLEYTNGADGKSYAIGGEVSIDMSKGNTPDETKSKMQQVKSSALAPSEPSGQDYAVASQATAMEMEALREATTKKTKEQQDNDKKESDNKIDTKKAQNIKEDEAIEDNTNYKKKNNIDESTGYLQSIDIFA